MENFNNYRSRAKAARSKNKLLRLWRYVMVLMPLLFLINTNSHASGSTQPTCLAPCENLRTQTMGGWGATPTKKGNSPANDLAANFSNIGPIVVGDATCNGGDGFTLTLTSADAVNKFLPSGSTPRPLDGDYINPTNASEGNKNGVGVYENVLAGQAVALTISIAMYPNSGLASAYVNDNLFGDELWTVAEVLAETNRILGGCESDYTPSQINEVLSKINESYVDGKRRSDYLLCPSDNTPEISLDADEECDGPTTITATVEGGNAPYSYKWFQIEQGAATRISDATTNILEVSVAGNYKVIVKDKYGCKDEAEITVEVWENPTVTLEADPVCDDDTKITASASGGSGEYTYTWYDPSGDVINVPDDQDYIYVSVAGAYRVVVTDENGCEGEDDIVVVIYVSPDLVVEDPGAACGPNASVDLRDAIISPEDLTGLIVSFWAFEPGEDDGDEEGEGIDPLVTTSGTYWIKIFDPETECYDKVSVVVTIAPTCGGDQGCTLGYWKNHTDRWCSDYETTTLFGNVFENAPDELADLTLLEALNLGGGDIYNLARQGVAALLNACSNGVEYEYDVETVISRVNIAFASGNAGVEALHLDDLNNSGCPLGGTRATSLSSEATSSLQGLAESHELRAYPTPFTDKAKIEFTVAQDENFSMRLYDMRGALVRELKSGEAKAGVVNTVEIDGGGLPEGLYIARMVSDSGTKTVKLLKKE